LREKVIGFLSASGVFEERGQGIGSHARDHASTGTLMERLEDFIKYEFSNTWFTTQELRERYETVADDIKLSTVSTYLSRMNRDGLLEKRGNRNNRQYKMIEPPMAAPQSYQRQNAYERGEQRADRDSAGTGWPPLDLSHRRHMETKIRSGPTVRH